jgi:hypothetical protein
MTDLLRLARNRLQMSNLELARQLEVSAGCVRSWDRDGAPRYARLAIAALMAGVDPDAIDPSFWQPIRQVSPWPPAAGNSNLDPARQ